MKAYKGFDKDLRCRGFQYEIGKEYVTDKAKLCECGFHACESPLTVFEFYPPHNGSRYCEVEQDGNTETDKGKTVSSKIKIGAEIGIIGLVKAHIEWVMSKIKNGEKNTGNCSAATNTGSYSAATNTGDFSAATNTGSYSVATNTGDWSAAEVKGKDSVALVTGLDGKAKGTLGCWLVLTEREADYHIIGMKAIRIDGKTYKADTWYKLEDGEIVKAKAC